MTAQILAAISSSITAICCIVLLILHWVWNKPRK